MIETTNFQPGNHIGTVGGSARPVPNSDQMKMIERLTLTGPDQIRYEAWVEDPVVLTAPYKIDIPWRRDSDYVQFEYACHEGNVQIRGYIEGTSPYLAERREQRAAMREAGEIIHSEDRVTLSSNRGWAVGN